MKTFRLILLSISILIGLYSQAEIREARSMRGVAPLLTQGTVVIFDLDNTVLEANQTLGTDQFFSFLVKKAEGQGFKGEAAKQQALRWATPIQPVTGVHLVEGGTGRFIKILQDLHLTVFALTARPAQWAAGTLGQVASLGIDFSLTAPRVSGLQSARSQNGNYANGVLFLPPNAQKGTVLVQFLRSAGVRPQQVIFIDDKLTNVQSVDAALTAAGIPNVDLRYGATDARVKAFDERIAEFEYRYFLQTRQFISDDVARRMMGH